MFDADFEPVRTMQSAWEKVHALRRRAQEEEVRFCLYERHEEAERTGEKQKKKLSGVRKNIGRKKEVEPRERDRKDERSASADIRKYIARDSRPNGKDGEAAATLFESAK